MTHKYFAAEFVNHTGGAEGADKKWKEIGIKYGVYTHIDWKPHHLLMLPPSVRDEIDELVQVVGRILHRPTSFKGIDLVKRNWFPVHHAQAIYAVSRIVEPGAMDKGFQNRAGKQVVSGGTGWTVQMAIQKSLAVYVFDMNTNAWYSWDYEEEKFTRVYVPILSPRFAGIGSRHLTPIAEQEIENCYRLTLSQLDNW